MSKRSAAPVPPNYRDADEPGECCGTCVMRNAATGLCWGYGDVLVQPDHVCDSWSPETDSARGGQPMKPEERAVLSSAEQNDLPDSAFAYIEAGGKKDADGKTTPRKLRHYPVHDKAHADNAAARAAQAIAAGGDAASIAKKALPKIKAAQAKFDTQSNSATPEGEERDQPTSEDWKVAQGLKELKGYVSQVKADQLMDPDNKTDPDDAAVCAALDEVEAAVDKAIVAQGNDKKWEPEESKSGKDWATAKRAFSSFIERPPAQVGELQVRMGDGETDPSAQFRGYAYTINERYGVTDWLGVYNERIGPGASSKTLREQDSIPMLRNHDANYVFANTRSGTSQLADDGRGLLNLADLDRRQTYTNDTCISLQRGDVAKMSFSFRAINEDWNEAYDDRLVRELQLYDTSIVTYPANPATTAELVDSMRSALGREGRSLWLADGELSVRSVLPIAVEQRSLPVGGGDLLERAAKALGHADEVLCRSHGPHGRARTFHVAGALMELRAGKALSSKNQALLKQAADALSAADKSHQKLADAHASAAGKIQNVLDASTDSASSQDGTANGATPGSGNPISPQDGAGPRSARALQLKRQREAELRALRGE